MLASLTRVDKDDAETSGLCLFTMITASKLDAASGKRPKPRTMIRVSMAAMIKGTNPAKNTKADVFRKNKETLGRIPCPEAGNAGSGEITCGTL